MVPHEEGFSEGSAKIDMLEQTQGPVGLLRECKGNGRGKGISGR